MRDRIEALEHLVDRLRRLERLRKLEACLIAPALERGWKKAFFVSGGSIRAVRSLPPPPARRTTRASTAAFSNKCASR